MVVVIKEPLKNIYLGHVGIFVYINIMVFKYIA